MSTKSSRHVNVMEEPIPPNYKLDSVKPPKYWGAPEEVEAHPLAYVRKTVSSVHAIDLGGKEASVSETDCASFGPSSSVSHGRYGKLGDVSSKGIPLEYLALLHPAAEGAAALRTLVSGSDENGGTVLVYGATRPAAMAASQLASASNCAVVAVVDGQHSGNDDIMEALKGSILEEPSAVIPEEYALIRRKLKDMVSLTANGDNPQDWIDTQSFLEEFSDNLLAYTEAFPSQSLPAAVNPSKLKFDGKAKDLPNFQANMEAYLSQYPAASPTVDPQILKDNLDMAKYAEFKKQFANQTTAVISGDDPGHYEPVSVLTSTLATTPIPQPILSDEYVPYQFDPLQLSNQPSTDIPIAKGGSLLGAIITATPELVAATQALEKAGKSIRAKAEALQFLTEAQRNAYDAARGIAHLAQQAGTPVIVVGGEVELFFSACIHTKLSFHFFN